MTLIPAAWLNDINDVSYTALGAVAGAGTITKVQFPATQVASGDANALDDYQEGSTTFTLTGCTTSPTFVGKWTKIGNRVDLIFPGTSQTGNLTSNATTKTFTGMPAELWPSGTIYSPACFGNDNSVGGNVFIAIGTNGVMTLSYGGPTGGAWTGSGTFNFTFPMMSWTVA